MNKKDQKKIKNEEKIEDKKYDILLNYIRYRLSIDDIISMLDYECGCCCDICSFNNKKEMCENFSCEDGMKTYLNEKSVEEE